jgi:hypothetical protein
MSVSKLNGVTWSGISKVNGVAKANVARVSSYLVTAGGGGGGGSVSTKSVVYDGVDATTLVPEEHSFSKILDNSAKNKATFSAWINLSDATVNHYRVIWGNDPQDVTLGDFTRNEFIIQPLNPTVPSYHGLRFDIYNSTQNTKLGTSTYVFHSQSTLSSASILEDWIHVCLVATPSAGGTGYDHSIYVNGSILNNATTPSSSFVKTNTIVAGDVGIGATYVVSSNSFVGHRSMKYSDYIIWSDELTSSEITEIYNAGVGGFDPSTDSGNYASSADLEIHYEVGNTAEDTTEAPVTNNTGTAGNLVHNNVAFEAL